MDLTSLTHPPVTRSVMDSFRSLVIYGLDQGMDVEAIRAATDLLLGSAATEKLRSTYPFEKLLTAAILALVALGHLEGITHASFHGAISQIDTESMSTYLPTYLRRCWALMLPKHPSYQLGRQEKSSNPRLIIGRRHMEQQRHVPNPTGCATCML